MTDRADRLTAEDSLRLRIVVVKLMDHEGNFQLTGHYFQKIQTVMVFTSGSASAKQYLNP
ncbi:hypothetical protein BaRGS_00007167, partial [Batillaria attramentaria]